MANIVVLPAERRIPVESDVVDLAAIALIHLARMGDKEGILFFRAARANVAGDAGQLMELLRQLEDVTPKYDARPDERLSAILTVVSAISIRIDETEEVA